MSVPGDAEPWPPLQRVLPAFGLAPDGARASAWGRGRIHASFRVRAGDREYLLQALNLVVFRDPAALGRNVARVTEHLARRERARRRADVDRRHLRLVRTVGGDPVLRCSDGMAWRLYHFIPGACSPSTPASPQTVRAVAHCFGRFLADMATLPGEALEETLPGFHDTRACLAAFEAAVVADPAGRASGAADAIDALRARAALAARFSDGIASGELPRRTVHYDCKLDNVLVDCRTGEPLCVVDLDTVMPGCVLYDVGDLIRSAAGGAEDSPAPAAERPMAFDLARYEAVLAGYLAGSAPLLEASERAGLAIAGPVVTYELAMRFLTDHLNGDRYFGVAGPGDNLARARRQLMLLQSMEDQATAMAEIAERVCSARASARV